MKKGLEFEEFAGVGRKGKEVMKIEVRRRRCDLGKFERDCEVG